MARHLIKSDATIRSTQKRRLDDGDGLYLLVKGKGAGWWRLDYSVLGKRKTISMGVYPDISLAVARDKAHEARQLIAQGVDPSDLRKAEKARRKTVAEEGRRAAAGLPVINSFEEVAREWFAQFSLDWAPSHANKIIRRLERDVFPWIGKRAIAEVTHKEILSVLRRIQERGALDTAHRAHQNCGQIFRYAIATERTDRNPCPDLRGALPSVKQKHYAAITEPKEIAALLRAIDSYRGYFVTKCALRLAPLMFVRPGELRAALWADIDFEKAQWNFLVSKTNTQHIVPLSTQAIAILLELHAQTGESRYVFPSVRTNDRPMCDNAILAALRRMGFSKEEMTGHGFRAMARTVLDEVLHIRPDYIEHQLAHAVRDPNGRAYNRTAHLKERKAMMQQWADYLDQLKETG